LNPDDAVTLTETVPPAQPPTLRWIFIGKDGLRAGWSQLIFVALLAAFAFSGNRIAHMLHAPGGPKPGSDIPPSFLLVAELIPFLVVLLITWIMSKIERRPNSSYGFGGSRKLPHFFAGLAWGVTCLSLLVLTLWKTGLLVIDSRLLSGSDILRYGAIWLFGFLLVGLQDSPQHSARLLDLGRPFFHSVRPRARQQRWRISDRTPLSWSGRDGFLFQSVAHRFALVGYRLSHLVGLGAIVPLRRRRQWDDGAAPSSRHTPRGSTPPERRCHRPRRQHLRYCDSGPHLPHHRVHAAQRPPPQLAPEFLVCVGRTLLSAAFDLESVFESPAPLLADQPPDRRRLISSSRSRMRFSMPSFVGR